MYIVTSKPKRMSEYSGLVHIIITSLLALVELTIHMLMIRMQQQYGDLLVYTQDFPDY
jgi:hypothetical protein